MKPAVGDVIGGKYRIVRLIGDGGMGTVYEARHEFLETSVALKFLHADLAKRAGLGSRFLQEARVSAQIRSPHVTHVTDVDQTADGSPYLVMELLHGEPLQQAMDRMGKLPPDQAVNFALQILSGLESAHAIGVVHRDLKPDNVFIVPASGGPLLKLIDFGIAKLRASTAFQKGLTRAGVIMGTPEYMAPEQLFAAENVDLRADLYSLGVILFEMLSGRRPADGDEVEQIVASVVSGNVRHLADLEPGLAPGLVAVVERALRPDREARFSSALEMRAALAPFAGALVTGQIAAVGQPLPRSASNRPPLTGPAQAFEVAPNVPKTLPPEGDPAMLAYKGGTQEVSDEAVREALRQSAYPPPNAAPAYGYPPAPAGYGPPPAAAHKRRSRTGLWIGLSLLIVLGLGGAALAAVFYQQHQPDTSAPPLVLDQPAPETTVNPLIDAGSATRVGTNPAVVPVTPTRPGTPTNTPGTPTTGPTVVRPSDAGAPVVTDAGRNQLPFPFPLPSTLPPLPSVLPPLPSTFPTLPKTFPSTLPPGFPAIPGFPLTQPAPVDGGK
ncbi:MAG TPA: serine/threonine-protein kinase [Polyangiaceae bacterium]|nr:serine/threonine-protein kinase [Polyangiaceae bacterium]